MSCACIRYTHPHDLPGVHFKTIQTPNGRTRLAFETEAITQKVVATMAHDKTRPRQPPRSGAGTRAALNVHYVDHNTNYRRIDRICQGLVARIGKIIYYVYQLSKHSAGSSRFAQLQVEDPEAAQGSRVSRGNVRPAFCK